MQHRLQNLETGRPLFLRGWKRLFLPASVSLFSILVLLYVARSHTMGTYETETDFYWLYAPDA